MDTSEAYVKLTEVQHSIERNVMTAERFGKKMIDPDEIILDNRTDPNEQGKREALYQILNHLKDARDLIMFYDKPVRIAGRAVKNGSGRYEVCGLELISGSVIEILYGEEEDEMAKWVRCTVEHDGEDYYATYGRMRLGGHMIRLRG